MLEQYVFGQISSTMSSFLIPPKKKNSPNELYISMYHIDIAEKIYKIIFLKLQNYITVNYNWDKEK